MPTADSAGRTEVSRYVIMPKLHEKLPAGTCLMTPEARRRKFQDIVRSRLPLLLDLFDRLGGMNDQRLKPLVGQLQQWLQGVLAVVGTRRISLATLLAGIPPDQLRRLFDDKSALRDIDALASFAALVIELEDDLAISVRRVLGSDFEVRKDVLTFDSDEHPVVFDLADVGSLTHLDMIGLTAARAAGLTLTGEGVHVAVLDTGIQADHPQFARDQIVASALCDGISHTFEVGMDGASDTGPAGHGTFVAGLIAGREVGVAPGVKLHNVVMRPAAVSTFANFLQAADYVISREAVDIVNISAGIQRSSGNTDPAVEQDRLALQARMQHIAAEMAAHHGKLIVASAGNVGPGNTDSPGDFPSVLSVGSCQLFQGRISLVAASNSGPVAPPLDSAGPVLQERVPALVAPGTGIVGCEHRERRFRWVSGTSAAAPIVSGIAALVLERDGKELEVTELVAAIKALCDPIGGRSPGAAADRQGKGLVKVPKAATP